MPSNSVGTQLARLLDLALALPSRTEAKTITQLLGGLDCGRKMLERDLNTLEQIGLAQRQAPVRDDPEDSRSPRWCANPRKSPYRPLLSTEQAIALRLVERLVKSLLPAHIGEVLKVEFDQARQRLNQQRKVDLRTHWVDKVEVISETFSRQPVDVKPPVLRAIQEALLTNRQVSARYKALTRGVSKKRPLEPRGLVQRGPTLYVIATRPDKPRSEPRWYAAHRFVSAHALDTPCSATTFRLDEYLEKGGADFGASGPPLAFKAWVSKELKRELIEAPLAPDMQFERDTDGAIVTAMIRRSWPFQRWLLSRGPDLRVLEPADLRDYMVRKLSEAREAYE